jgi:hypothetical protein
MNIENSELRRILVLTFTPLELLEMLVIPKFNEKSEQHM